MIEGFQSLLEGDIATESLWVDRFGGDAQVFQELLADGILKGSGIYKGKRRFTLNYVGLISIRGAVWFSFPKINTTHDWSDAEIVLKSILEYRRKVYRAPRSIDFTSSEDRIYGGTLIDTLSALVLHTLDRGFHHQEENEVIFNHTRIDWPRTINSSPALHSKSSVFYPSPISRVQNLKLSDLAVVQATALLDMRSRLKPLDMIVIPEADDLWEECRRILKEFNSNLFDLKLKEIIDDYANNTNRDEDAALISILRDWLTEDWASSLRLSAFGVSSFHTLWEDMCVQAFSSFGPLIAHKEIAKQPKYIFDDQEVELTPQRPDILINSKEGIIIADAKWYILDEIELPGTPDAIKQFSYEYSVSQRKKVIANLLLLPSELDVRWKLVGWLEMGYRFDNDSSMGTSFPRISVIGLNWKFISEIYINRQPLPENFTEFVFKIRN